MNQNEMIQSLRAEIAKLQRVLDLLLERPSDLGEVRRPGRPKGSGARATSAEPETSTPKKRVMSTEGKARIAAAQKKRWAAQKAAAPEPKARTKAASKKGARKAVRRGPDEATPKAAKKSAAE